MVARIALPDTLSPATFDAFEQSLARVRSPAALVLDGACRGMDLESFLDADAGPHLARFADLLRALRAVECPTIAMVDGAMIGGGVGIAAVCDVVIASPRTSFALPEALFGLLPGVVVPALLHRMSPHAIHLLALVGTARSADWGTSVGLVDEVSADPERSITRWVRALGRADRRRIVELREWTSTAGSFGANALHLGAGRSTRAISEPHVRELARAFVREGEAPWLR